MIVLLDDGTLQVPMAALDEASGMIGDGIVEYRPGDPEYRERLREYREQQARLYGPPT